MTRSPTTEQLAELAKYAAWAGRCWKQELLKDWMRGSRYPGEWGYLQQLRNEQGPRWLNKYKLVTYFVKDSAGRVLALDPNDSDRVAIERESED